MVEATHKNLPPSPKNFRHLDSLLDGEMAAEFRKKAMHAWIPRLQRHTYGKLLLEKRWFAWESWGMLLTGIQRWSKKTVRSSTTCSQWQNFHGFNFHGWRDPWKFQHNENFCVYGNAHCNVYMYLYLYLHVHVYNLLQYTCSEHSWNRLPHAAPTH